MGEAAEQHLPGDLLPHLMPSKFYIIEIAHFIRKPPIPKPYALIKFIDSSTPISRT